MTTSSSSSALQSPHFAENSVVKPAQDFLQHLRERDSQHFMSLLDKYITTEEERKRAEKMLNEFLTKQCDEVYMKVLEEFLQRIFRENQKKLLENQELQLLALVMNEQFQQQLQGEMSPESQSRKGSPYDHLQASWTKGGRTMPAEKISYVLEQYLPENSMQEQNRSALSPLPLQAALDVNAFSGLLGMAALQSEADTAVPRRFSRTTSSPQGEVQDEKENTPLPLNPSFQTNTPKQPQQRNVQKERADIERKQKAAQEQMRSRLESFEQANRRKSAQPQSKQKRKKIRSKALGIALKAAGVIGSVTTLAVLS